MRCTTFASKLGLKMVHLSQIIFFGEKSLMFLHLPIGSFSCVKLKTKNELNPELWGRRIFGRNNLRIRFFPRYSFHRMLMDHKNFHFTPILDQTNEQTNDFLKKSKNPVFEPFWPFLVIFAKWGFIIKKKRFYPVPHPDIFWAYLFLEVKDWIV